MYIKKDFSYICEHERQLADNGYGKMSVHSIVFDRYFTDVQKEQNKQRAESMSAEEWGSYCDAFGESLAVPMADILSVFTDKFDIHQISEETSTTKHFKSDWDLHFWSDKGWNKKEYMTCFRLTFNDNRSPKQNMGLLENIIPIVESMEYENVYCRVQYTIVIDEQRVNDAATDILERLVEKSMVYNGMPGRFKVVSDMDGVKEYGFFRKYKRNKYIPVSKAVLLSMHLNGFLKEA